MSCSSEALTNAANASKPAKETATTLKDGRQADMDASVKTVASILEAKGHCPVTKLIEAQGNEKLEPHQQAAVNKWLMEMAYAKPKSIELTGKGGGAIPLYLTSDDADL